MLVQTVRLLMLLCLPLPLSCSDTVLGLQMSLQEDRDYYEGKRQEG